MILITVSALGVAAQAAGKPPVIIIPGITGSELVNPKTGRTVWFSVRRDKDDDIRLPINSTILSRDRDTLKVRDIIRKLELPVLPDVAVYQTVIDALIAQGYTEGDWNKPKATDVFYVFPYDWRRDNVESAQQLIAKMVAVKKKLRRSNMKFDIIAHSMGGLIARYAAMYGAADLPPAGKVPVPTWAGAAHIDKLLMFGTPNQGSFSAFQSLLNGYPIVAGSKLPLIDDLRPEDVLTSPAAFEVLPHQASMHFYDEDLKPISIDLYDPETWFKYGWGALSEPKFLGKLKDAAALAAKDPAIKVLGLPKNPNRDDILTSQTTFAQAKAYFVAVLSRGKRFQAALDAPSTRMPIQLLAYGGNCQPTLDGAILIADAKKEKWTTVITARDIKTDSGKEIKKDAVKNLLFPLGDGTVTQASLLVDADSPTPVILPVKAKFFGCSTHTKLFLDKPIQDSFLSALVVSKQSQP